MRPSALPFAAVVHLLRAAAAEGVHPSRLHVLALMTGRYLATEPLRLAERWRHEPRMSAPLTDDPIVVLGHWRSGTSMLQTLLADDPRHTTSTLYRSLFGDISGGTEPWLKPAMDLVAATLRLPFSIQRMPLRLDIPAECDIGLCCQLSTASYSWGHLFPVRFDDWLRDWVLELDAERAAEWLDDLDRFLRKLSAAAGGRRVVVKSPGDTARVRWLVGRYPDARFVYIHRDPTAVFHSCRYLWQVIRREYSLHRLTDADIDRRILETYPKLIGAYLAQRDALAPGQLVEVRNEHLRRDPGGTLERIHAGLGLGAVDPDVLARLVCAPATPRPRYETPPALARRLREAWAVGFDWTERA